MTIGGKDRTFMGDDGTEYTIDTTEGKLTLGEDGSVIVDDRFVLTGEENDTFTFGEDTVTIPAGGSIGGKHSRLFVKSLGGDDDTKVSIDSTTGAIGVIAGKVEVDGETTVAVRITDGSISSMVDVTIPTGCTYIIDADEGTVSGLGTDERVTVGDVTYISGTDSGEFPLDHRDGALTNPGDTAIVSGDTGANIRLGEDPSIVVIVPGTNIGSVTITKGTTSTVTIADIGDQVTIGNRTYVADSSYATFTIDSNGNVSVTDDTITTIEKQTGEDATVATFIALMALSLSLFVLAAVIRKR